MSSRVVTAAVALVAVAAGLAAGLLLAGGVLRSSTPAEGSADVGFARDMQTHHAQAVEMALIAYDRTQDAHLRQVALDIVLTQQQQQGQMYGWLAVWGLTQASSAAPMAWAGHGHGEGGEAGGTMPGIATPEQMTALREAEGVEADRLFVELMITHHEGGVEMARAALELADQPAVRRLAQAVVDSQTAEIAVLRGLLADLD